MIWQLRQRWISVSVALIPLGFAMAVVADCNTPRCKEHTVKGRLDDGNPIECNKTGHSICWLPTIRSNADLGAPTDCVDHSTVTVQMWVIAHLIATFNVAPVSLILSRTPVVLLRPRARMLRLLRSVGFVKTPISVAALTARGMKSVMKTVVLLATRS